MKVRLERDLNSTDVIEVQTGEPELRVRLGGIDRSIVHNVFHDKYKNTPTKLIKDEFVLVLKMKLMDLFINKEVLPNSLDKEEVLNSLETVLVPIIDNYIGFILSIDVIDNYSLNVIMNELSNIVFSYIKLEFLKHFLDFKDSFNKNYIDEIFEYMTKRIKGEEIES